jgi:cephalosporin-C deacetylase-like acetyl esterase
MMRTAAGFLAVLVFAGACGNATSVPGDDLDARSVGADRFRQEACDTPLDLPLPGDRIEDSGWGDLRAGPDTATVDEVMALDLPSGDLGDASSALDWATLDGFDLDVVSEPDSLAPPVVTFDHASIQDAASASCTFDNHHTVLKDGVLLDVWHVSYWSWEAMDGELVPIQIQGFAARPALTGGALPGIVNAHGLGGYAEASNATGPAALLGMFVLAYTGPGGGTAPDNTSQGLPASYDNGYRMFDVLDDVRGTWFWGHAVAAMRGLTCLAHHPDVDSARLGVTGFSAGGVISHIVAAVDPRVKAAVPLSGTLAWDVATQSPSAWQHALLEKAGLSVASAEWLALMALLSPTSLYTAQSAPVMMVNGSSDEFFPLPAHAATYGAISATKRMSLAGNFDHGCYLLTGGESAATIEARAELRAKGAQQLWFHHHFGTDARFAYIPVAPTFVASPVGLATAITATVDPGGPHLQVDSVHVWWSNDDAFLFGSVPLVEQAPGIYGELALFPLQPYTVLYVDVQYKTKDWVLPQRFSLTSEPHLPAGFIPHIRDVETCL